MILSAEHLKFVDYVNLSIEESIKILEIRNSKEISMWMLNDKEITIEDHLKFVNKLKTDQTKKYYAIYYDNEMIGSTSLVNIVPNEIAESGFYSNPKFFKTNYGLLVFYNGLSQMINEFKIKKVVAGYFEENANAALLTHAFGFKIYNKTQKNSRSYIEISLDTNDWIYDLTVREVLNKILLYKRNNP